MAPEMVEVSWNDFSSSASNTIKNLIYDQDFNDVTIACEDDMQIKAHKVVLSSGSSFFKRVLVKNPHQHPLVYLKGVKYGQLKQMIKFIYLGEIKITETEVNSFIELGKDLEVEGIIDEPANKETIETNLPTSCLDTSVKMIEDPVNNVENEVLVPKIEIETEALEEFCDLGSIKDREIKQGIKEPVSPKVAQKDGIYECKKCEFTSIHWATVRKHKISKHDGIRYKCPQSECEKTFSDTSSLLRHRKATHDGFIYKCETCEKVFSEGSTLTKHNKSKHSVTQQ